MGKVRLDILGLSQNQPSNMNSFALMLGEHNGNRRLPIIIGMFEAQAIAIEMEKIEPNRPMTHDLFYAFAEAFGFTLKSVLISELKEGIFYAKIIGKTKTIANATVDARPSDAIAIAMRFDIPIYVENQVLDEAGITISEDKPPQKPKKSYDKKDLKDLSIKALNERLKTLIKKEKYEEAARVRDEINRRN